MTTNQYIETVNTRFKSGISREHSYRGDLESLIRELVKGVDITNEPSNVTDCGNPDYVITKGKIPIGYIEAKDIDKDLNGKQYKEQFTRYKKALENLIITDYIWFQFFQNGVLVHEIRIAEIENNSVKPIVENFQQFETLIQNFCTYIGQTIKSSKKLAEMMASKAKLLQNILENAVTSDEATQENTSLRDQYKTFKQILIHELEPEEFADIYSQTLAYGMFAARLHDTTLEDFTRQEAAELIPKSNPFLRKLFGYVAGPDIDERIKRTVDNLADVFRATNVEELLKNFGKSTQTNDPIIHFYETFLSEYDPKLRKSRGVWYTPEPVVNFIVRAVDDILKTEFNLPQGLADTSKTKIKVPEQGSKKLVEKEVHKVQILDPATGTGTFLAEVVKLIYNKNFQSMQGAWSSYVEEHLIPRLNGFELLMASYSMAHLKLDMLLRETGYKSTKDQRFNIYLTNSLEEHHPDTGTLFSNWLSTEANDANHIKRDTPVMCVIGNPPYSGESSNKGNWIMSLMEDYKKEPSGKQKLNEQNSKFINDDYVKFLRYGQYYIEKNGEGILAFINPHGFLDNPTFRGMRWNLLKTYDKIYTIDLHGNSKKKEISPDGSPDVNVFDIMQGVSINLFVKTGNKKANELGKVYHYDLYGKRENKYNFLWKNNIRSVPYVELPNVKPNYFFIKKDFRVKNIYEKGFSVIDLYKINSLGIQTHRDSLSIDASKEKLINRISDFYDENVENIELKNKYKINENSEWQLKDKRLGKFDLNKIIKIEYRPFDTQFIYNEKTIVDRLRNTISKHIIGKDNFCLVVSRQCVSDWRYIFISKFVIESNLTGTAGRFGSGNFFPLYLYSDDVEQQNIDGILDRTPNLNQEIVNRISEKIGLIFVPEKEETELTYSPIDVLDYIYAVLHSPTYREKYKEFLKIDFPRVPYPKNNETFWKLVKLGGEIRELHLLESPKVNESITSYPIGGDNKITRKLNKNDWEIIDEENQLGRIWINDEQYFDNIPLIAWEFYIGGYQPAQKWLKDRRGRDLIFEDILHYQKIIVSLFETDRLMKEIDLVGVE
ncbi:MAG: N-6 DNA methylase [Melioribacteraceae bacterium]|jgi:predicted helicase|nr:N-6 DNA methylase [Melioribacteraceae bacterium]